MQMIATNASREERIGTTEGEGRKGQRDMMWVWDSSDERDHRME